MRRAGFFAPLIERSGTHTHRRLRRAADLPRITDVPAREWSRGWWAGIAVGVVNGVAVAVLLGWLR